MEAEEDQPNLTKHQKTWQIKISHPIKKKKNRYNSAVYEIDRIISKFHNNLKR